MNIRKCGLVGSLLMVGALASAQNLHYRDDRYRTGIGTMYGDSSIKVSNDFNRPNWPVYLKISGWQSGGFMPSELVVYVWDRNNPWSPFPYSWYIWSMNTWEKTAYFPISVPARFAVQIRARCNQYYVWGGNNTVTTSHLFQLWWNGSSPMAKMAKPENVVTNVCRALSDPPPVTPPGGPTDPGPVDWNGVTQGEGDGVSDTPPPVNTDTNWYDENGTSVPPLTPPPSIS